ncbi:MAG TPA: WecB/TagA/CpsF family glycosyltransferase [Dongiaceae bacterium]|nr:WecB/TagA/CpsF family glycosyltransferase [Dongiaceae bacterium]
MITLERLKILDTPVDVVDMAGALDFVDRYIAGADKPGYILAVNPEKVYALRENPFLKDFFQEAALLIPDGIGMVYAMRLLAGKKVSRVPGADLMQQICARSAGNGHRIFIYGATEEVNRGAVEELQNRYPGINIVGRANGYVKPEEMDALVERINRAGTDILFVALGSPRQEKWLHEHLPKLSIKLAQGIGGTLDTITGHVKRAPQVFQSLGLEWFYRLASQPSRAGRQKRLPLFAWEILTAKLRRK